MRAAVFRGPGEIQLEEMPIPHPALGEALMRVGCAGICATDLRIFKSGHHRIPIGTTRILGHELAGEIVETGDGVIGLAPGMHVGVAPNVGCGICRECVTGWTNLCQDYQAFGISLDGAFAEYMLITAQAIRQGNVMVIPPDTSYPAAALAEPLSCCLNGQEAVRVGPDDIVVIVGAGPIGIMHLLLAKLRGARRVVVSEVSQPRLLQAIQAGAQSVVNPQEQRLREVVLEISEGRGADVVVVAAGSAEAQAESLELAGRRGRIVFFGGLRKDQPMAHVNANLIHYGQLLVTGTTGSSVRQYRSALQMITDGRIDARALIGDVLPLEKVHEGFRRTESAGEMRIILQPGNADLRRPMERQDPKSTRS